MNYYQISCCVVSIFLNSILVLLIITKSPRKLGIYKYLMLNIAVYEILYSIFDAITEPNIHSYNGAFMVFRNYIGSLFNREHSAFLVALYCGFFGCSLAFFGVHFIYRYGAVDSQFYKIYLSGKKITFLFIMPVCYFCWWAGLIIVFFQYTKYSDIFLKSTIRDVYNLKIEDISYICVIFHPRDENGISHPDYQNFAIFICPWFMIMSSIFCVTFFGTKCYSKIRRVANVPSSLSKTTKSLQQQLFQALLVQTVIPLVFLYVPIFILFSIALLNLEMEFDNSFVTFGIATFPAIDPLPNMLIIGSYRHAIQDFFRLIVCQPVKAAARVSTVSKNQSTL